MRLSTRRCLLCISLLLTAGGLRAQASFPEKEGETVRYRAYIETRRGYVSGICLLRLEGGEVNGCLVNEFGITGLSFTYDLKKGKTRLHDVLPMLDKWAIRRVLKKDLSQVMDHLRRGETGYRNERRGICYHFDKLIIDN